MISQNYFVAVDLTLPLSDINQFEKTHTHGYPDISENKSYGSLDYYEFDSRIKDFFKEKLPKDLQPLVMNVKVAVIQGQTIMPHIDHNGSVILNFYYVPGNARTCFYTAKPNAKPIPAAGQKTSNVYYFEDLDEQCGFVAEPNSCYLLNISKIHSVSMKEHNSVRKILQFTFSPDAEYKKIFDKIQQLGLIKNEMA